MCPSQKTLTYHEIYEFSVNYKSMMYMPRVLSWVVRAWNKFSRVLIIVILTLYRVIWALIEVIGPFNNFSSAGSPARRRSTWRRWRWTWWPRSAPKSSRSFSTTLSFPNQSLAFCKFPEYKVLVFLCRLWMFKLWTKWAWTLWNKN